MALGVLIAFGSTVLAGSGYAQRLPAEPCDAISDKGLWNRLGSGLQRKLLARCGAAKDLGAVATFGAKAGVAVEGGLELEGFSGHEKSGFHPWHGGDIQVNRPDPLEAATGTFSTQSETSIVTVGRRAVCAAWNDSGSAPALYALGVGGFSGFGYSPDDGKSWIDGGAFPVGATGDSDSGDPSLAYSDRDDTVYYAALSGFGLSLWKSTDKCRTFTYVGPIHVGLGDDKELMAVDNNKSSPYYGRIHVGWTDFAAATDINVASYSDDGGLTWSTPAALPGSGINGQGMWPAVAPNGDVYFALLNRSFDVGGLQDQWIYKSTDGGDSWVQMADIATGQLRPENATATGNCGRQALNGNIRNLSSPQIAITKSPFAPAGYVIHAVYPYDSDGADPDNSNVFYRRSTDGAASWSAEVQLNDDATTTDQFFPALTVGEGGRFSPPVVAVSWYDRRLDPANLNFDRFAVLSKDGGWTWKPNKRISDVSSTVGVNFDLTVVLCYHGDYDQMAFRDGKAHILWSDDRRVTAAGPNPDIYYQNIETGRYGW